MQPHHFASIGKLAAEASETMNTSSKITFDSTASTVGDTVRLAPTVKDADDRR